MEPYENPSLCFPNNKKQFKFLTFRGKIFIIEVYMVKTFEQNYSIY